MLTAKDLQKISGLVATKKDVREIKKTTDTLVSEVSIIKVEVRELKETTNNLREVVQGLITAADRLAKTI